MVVLPPSATAAQIQSLDPPVDAVFLSNGPGDPASLGSAIAETKSLIGHLPLLGICLGHQIIAHALGGTTEKMKFGHHGGNHPVRESGTGKVFVTAQNHGYCVVPGSLPAGTEIWFTNANDGTVEGLSDAGHGVLSVQFHPEAAPGPRECALSVRSFCHLRAKREKVGESMPSRTDIHSILLIGSGPIVIGQACEFDYSGNPSGAGAERGGLPGGAGQSEPRHRDDHRGDLPMPSIWSLSPANMWRRSSRLSDRTRY